MPEQVECVVIGAGVIGLAIARTLACAGREVLVLEQEKQFGTGISSRSSEVIHAGLYDRQDSLKARLCVRGNRMLYAYCDAHQVAYRRCGKLVVATDPKQIGTLQQIAANAAQNGVEELHWLDGAQAQALEPALNCAAALLSPSSGIVDSHALMRALLGEAEAHGALLAVQSPVLHGKAVKHAMALVVGGPEPTELHAQMVINCAGLDAPRIARALQGVSPSSIPELHLAKGNYFSLSGASPFAHLIYPVPEDGGLGVHLTLDLGGQARFGPDVEWVDAPSYDVDPARAQAFIDRIRTYWPGIVGRQLAPAYAGVRPKLARGTRAAADFLISDATQHGVHNLINLYGIESPGLTACLALAAEIAERVERARAWA